MKNFVLFLVSIFTSSILLAQDLYVVTNANELKIINLETFQVTDLFAIDIYEVGYIVDIAFSPNGDMYGVTGNRTLLQIDLNNQSYTIIANLPNSDSYPGLVCNNNNELITSSYLGGILYKYNLDTQSLNSVTDNASTPGDFTIYKGNLVYPSTFEANIQSYNGSTFTTVGCVISSLFTFVNSFENCTNNTIYAIDENNKIYKYNLETTTFELVADLIGVVNKIYGGATLTEHLASACTIEPLMSVNCELSATDFSQNAFNLFPNPANTYLNITIPVSFQQLEFTIFDNLGRIVFTERSNKNKIDISVLIPGVYFLRLKVDGRNVGQTEKFIKT